MDPRRGFDRSPLNDSTLPSDLGLDLVLRMDSLVDTSLYRSNQLHVLGNLAISCISKFSAPFFLWLSTLPCPSPTPPGASIAACSRTGSKALKHIVPSPGRDLVGLLHHHLSSVLKVSGGPLHLTRAAAASLGRLLKEMGKVHSLPLLSLAAAVIPPFENISSKMLGSIPVQASRDLVNMSAVQASCEQQCRDHSSTASLYAIRRAMNTVEPNTGINFPTILETSLAKVDETYKSMEVLVGTGFKGMKIIKFKSLKLYAFGLYIQPDSVCEKLGPKYASVPVNDLEEQPEFFSDLLRADIYMTVRLVINCNGIKIGSVKNAFEKTLRDRLRKMNPETDYQCVSSFGSYFDRDIPLPTGTMIDFRKTADGRLITEIGGEHIGTVQSKDLCRAFFDMYIGDGPVSVEAKREVAHNVADLIRRC